VALHKPNTIDALSEDDDTGTLVLSLFDEVDWSDVPGHWALLCTKLDCYLNFLAGGEVLKHHPAFAGGPFRIEVVFRHAPPPEIEEAMEKTQQFVALQAHSLAWGVYAF
jgi:hypothetical protein